MDYIIFSEWLKNRKNYSDRSAKDVVCRCKRVNKIVDKDNFDNQTLALLIESETYENMSKYVKSQLKRAITLYQEFERKEMN